ncbi:MAG TPA: glycine zipper 2TM domain-containing protein [Azospirillaceae bacterium]|nr:glycine zipper 2TM domain-containing protein [Azospirillaceae bacterium]
MRFRPFANTCAIAATLVLAGSLSAPALAHGHKHHPDDRLRQVDPRPYWGDRHYDGAREDWLRDCRRRISDNGLGGAVIGGAAGGLLGNRIAGRGDRVVGTVAGAAVGAVAGAAIDRAEDGAHDRDACEAYLDDYYADYGDGPGYGYQAYGYPAYGYAVPMVMVPVMVRSQKPCVETVVTEEYVTTPARRNIRRMPRAGKRIRIAPDKRIPMK